MFSTIGTDLTYSSMSSPLNTAQVRAVDISHSFTKLKHLTSLPCSSHDLALSRPSEGHSFCFFWLVNFACSFKKKQKTVSFFSDLHESKKSITRLCFRISRTSPCQEHPSCPPSRPSPPARTCSGWSSRWSRPWLRPRAGLTLTPPTRPSPDPKWWRPWAETRLQSPPAAGANSSRWIS